MCRRGKCWARGLEVKYRTVLCRASFDTHSSNKVTLVIRDKNSLLTELSTHTSSHGPDLLWSQTQKYKFEGPMQCSADLCRSKIDFPKTYVPGSKCLNLDRFKGQTINKIISQKAFSNGAYARLVLISTCPDWLQGS